MTCSSVRVSRLTDIITSRRYRDQRAPGASGSVAKRVRICYRHRQFAPRGAQKGPGKAVQGRRDPVTVIGDETRERATGREAGKARGVGRSESQETCPGAHQNTRSGGGPRECSPLSLPRGGRAQRKAPFPRPPPPARGPPPFWPPRARAGGRRGARERAPPAGAPPPLRDRRGAVRA